MERKGEAPWARLPTSVIRSYLRASRSPRSPHSSSDHTPQTNPEYLSASSSPLLSVSYRTDPITNQPILLRNILGNEQRLQLYRTIALKNLVQRGEISLDRLYKLNVIQKMFDPSEDKLKKESIILEQTGTVVMVYSSRLSVSDLIRCKISITQIHHYFASTFDALKTLGITKRDLCHDRSLLNLTWLATLYDPDILLNYFKFTVEDIASYHLTFDDLRLVGFRFHPSQCTYDNHTLVFSKRELSKLHLSPSQCVELGMTLDMIRGLRIDEKANDAALVHTGWAVSDFQAAFVDVT